MRVCGLQRLCVLAVLCRVGVKVEKIISWPVLQRSI